MLLLLAASPVLAYVSPVQAQSASGFTVASAVWGTSAAPAQAAPGNQNVPLTITLQYYYYNTAQGISATLFLPTGFTDTNGNSSPTAYWSTAVPSGSVIVLTYYLDIASNAALGTYSFPMTISWGAVVNSNPPQSVTETQTASATVQLRGKVLLQFSAGEPTLSPGTVNHVPIIVTNGGTGNASSIDLSLSASSSLLSSASVSVLNSPPEISTVGPNSSFTTYVDIYAPQSLAGSSISLTIGGSYNDAYGNLRTIAATVGIYVSSTSSAPITISAKSLQLIPGSVNNVTLVVANTGQLVFSQIQLSVAVPPSMSLLRQFPVTVSNLAAGASAQVQMPVFVSSGVSGTPLTVTATVTYTDSAGNTNSATQSLGFYAPISQSPTLGLSGFSYNPALIFPGTTVAALQVVIFNSGTTPGSNVNVTLIPSEPVYSISKGSLTQAAGLLPVGQSAPFTFTIGIVNSTEPLNSTLTLVVSSSGVPAIQYIVPFVEQPKADFKVVSTSAPTISSGDGADQVTVTLRNVGGASAQLTTFTMQPSYVFEPSTQGSFTTSASAGVGTVAPGAEANLTVVVQVNSNVQAGRYPLVFHATWTQLGSAQPFGEDIRLMLPVQLSVFQITNSILLSAPFLVVIVLLVLAFLMLRRRRRRGPPKTKETEN
jgi:hypothetical protein